MLIAIQIHYKSVFHLPKRIYIFYFTKNNKLLLDLHTQNHPLSENKQAMFASQARKQMNVTGEAYHDHRVSNYASLIIVVVFSVVF